MVRTATEPWIRGKHGRPGTVERATLSTAHAEAPHSGAGYIRVQTI